jgi:prophage regulatory protein
MTTRAESRKGASLKPIYLDLPTVAALVSLSPANIQKLVREDRFPRPRMLSGRRVAWLMREVEEWAESCPVSDLPPPHNTSHGNRRRSTSQENALPAPLAAATVA